MWDNYTWIICAAAAKSLQSCPTLCDPVDGSPPDSTVHGDSPGKKHWSGFLHSPPGDLPDPEDEPASLPSPTLAGGFFTTRAP